MKRINTTAIVLNRINYGEADRIITLLTSSEGKITLIAKGVRKEKSKLAGGIELFCLNEITYLKGKRDLGTLISSRMDKSFFHILKDINKVQFGYNKIKQINRATEDLYDQEYFELLKDIFNSLNEDISINLIELWFSAQLLNLAGYKPNLNYDELNNKLDSNSKYTFNLSTMSFKNDTHGQFNRDKIKALRLLFSQLKPSQIINVQGALPLIDSFNPLINLMVKSHLDIIY
ncbi:MAG TPA: DNA repair protein RecO [Patescibacteria group bacterium]|nr:DNA repair protein RecO [Patescibacteria group bacterium]